MADFRRSLVGVAVACVGAAGAAQAATDASGVWRSVRARALAAPASDRVLAPDRYHAVALDRARLAAVLSEAPLERTDGAAVVLVLPQPDGSFGRFRVEESPILAPELAAQHPELRTYHGRGIDDPTATTRFDLTPAGFHALILSASGTIVVERWSSEDQRHYVSYAARDLPPPDPEAMSCLVSDLGSTANRVTASRPSPGAGPWGDTLRTYRLALAATGEFTTAAGGPTKALGYITTIVNNVNAIYERDIAVRLQLVANQTSIIYATAGTDPYTGSDKGSLMLQNQTNLDAVIGSANYDIGHLFTSGSAGASNVYAVCDDYRKAGAVTATTSPLSVHFSRLVAHEMGHQFGALHTFNNSSNGACGWAGQRVPDHAVEPGSGSTILSYGGTCSGENVVPERDDYLHSVTQGDFQWYIANYATPFGNCQPTETATGNALPTVTAGADWSIPVGTPFTLTGNGSDADAGDTLSYTWEEVDTGTQSPPSTDDGSRPIFRSFPPSLSPARTFPKMDSVLNPPAGCGSIFECLPITGRSMELQLTARDNHAGGGGSAFDSAFVTSVLGVGPFVVTAPAASSWPAGSSQTVTWSVAGTDGAPLNCLNVKISLSTDGGTTFPTILAASTPNDGSQAVTLPTTALSHGRIKVECPGQIFFNVSKPDFTISSPTSIADVGLAEGNTGTVNAVFTVSLAQTSLETITVHYATAPGTATAGTDYTTTAGNLTFAPGSLTQTLAVPIKGDTMYEANETFLVNLSAVTGPTTLADAQAVGTIQNDDPLPSLTIGDATVLEGLSGSRNMVFNVTLSAVSGAPATVSYTTSDGTASAPADYTAVTGGALSFAPGTTLRTLAIPVLGDSIAEAAPQTFTVNLSAPSGASIADGQGLGTITEDDLSGALAFSLGNYPTSEAANTVLLTVKRTGGLASGVTVDYATSDGSATVAGGDYTTNTGTLSFGYGMASRTFAVTLGHDTKGL